MAEWSQVRLLDKGSRVRFPSWSKYDCAFVAFRKFLSSSTESGTVPVTYFGVVMLHVISSESLGN
uniref:SFRICE_021866 n=1 Tax=Spodoptera frugiperda TaxID=7108 RepID=A0A2H1WHG6_SPOFR